MNTSRKSAGILPCRRHSQAGNAMIYILIAVALFGALTFILARQNDTTETGALNAERTEIAAAQIIQTSMQLKQAIDQMMYSGSKPDDLDFVTPDDEPAFSTAPNHHKVFHPAGGGVIINPLPAQAVRKISDNPPPRWYIGRFINIEWTNSADQEVIMTAHQISEPVCRAINQKLLGDPAPLAATVNPRSLLISGTVYSAANPVTWQNVNCPACVDKIAGCVMGPSEVPGKNIYSFYSVVVVR